MKRRLEKTERKNIAEKKLTAQGIVKFSWGVM